MSIRETKASDKLFEEAKNYFPGGVHSPVRAFKAVGRNPIFIQKGDGHLLTDEDGNEYVDFCCSWGPLILGHNDPDVRSKIIEAVNKGTTFGAPTKLGNHLGKLILDNHRFIEKIRFVSSGTEAVMSAIRLARGVTNKRKIIKFDGCYHGHVDSLLVKAGSGLATYGISTSAGIPESYIKKTTVLQLGDIELIKDAFRKFANDIACLIIEPIPANNGLLLQKRSYLKELRELCDKFKVLLIFDEVISGFRVEFEGAAGYYDIKPDIITFGKIIGGGMPVGAYAGSSEIMSHIAPEGEVYQAGTLSANPVAMAAGAATIEKLLSKGFYKSLNQKTRTFVKSLQKHCDAKGYPIQVQSVGSIFWINFSEEKAKRPDEIPESCSDKFKTFHSELLNRGIYIGPSGYEVCFISTAHSEIVLDDCASKFKEALDVVHEKISEVVL